MTTAWKRSSRLKEQGKIRAAGFSVMSVDEGIPLAIRLIEQGDVDIIQQAYRLLYTLPSTELFPLAEARSVGVIARENFYFGFLTGAITRETVFDDHDDRRKFSPASLMPCSRAWRSWAFSPTGAR